MDWRNKGACADEPPEHVDRTTGAGRGVSGLVPLRQPIVLPTWLLMLIGSSREWRCHGGVES
jgi:hypothetical protein